jgi:EpsI family protein
MNLPGGKPAAALVAVLLLQAVAYYRGVPAERVPARQPLAGFPERIQVWTLTQEFPMDPQVQATLRADDTLNRDYIDAAGSASVNLFIAYFQSQRYGQAPHSPKNCLPGAGFEPEASGVQAVPVPGRTIYVNRYVVSRGDDRKLVLYWYQSRDRVVASEYSAKVRLVLDALRYHRSDTALVRVTVSAPRARDELATRIGADFIRCVFPSLFAFLPS